MKDKKKAAEDLFYRIGYGRESRVERPTENQQASNKLLTTIEEGKKVRREESNNNTMSGEPSTSRGQPYAEIIDYLNLKAGTRYKGLEWYEIGDKMGYSERHIHRFHGKALAHFQIPDKNVIECQSHQWYYGSIEEATRKAILNV